MSVAEKNSVDFQQSKSGIFPPSGIFPIKIHSLDHLRIDISGDFGIAVEAHGLRSQAFLKPSSGVTTSTGQACLVSHLFHIISYNIQYKYGIDTVPYNVTDSV